MIGAIIIGGIWIRRELDKSWAKTLVIADLLTENKQLKEENARYKERMDRFLTPEDKVPLEAVALKHKWEEIATLSTAVAEADYTKEYACFNFSADLRNMLQKVGIPSKIDIVRQKDSKDFHAIVSIQIEPQSGQFVYYEANQLVDQCYKSGTDGKYYCGHGVIETEKDGKETYSRLEN